MTDSDVTINWTQRINLLRNGMTLRWLIFGKVKPNLTSYVWFVHLTAVKVSLWPYGNYGNTIDRWCLITGCWDEHLDRRKK